MTKEEKKLECLRYAIDYARSRQQSIGDEYSDNRVIRLAEMFYEFVSK